MSEHSKGREGSEQSVAREQVSGASERAKGWASGPILTSLFLFVPDHSAMFLHTAIRPYRLQNSFHVTKLSRC